MRYQEMPHAAVNVLMQWVRQQGQHIVSLHTCLCLAEWSSPPEWSAHIEVQGMPPLHARIKRNSYIFAVVHEPDGAFCPVCDALRSAARGSHNSMRQAGDLTTQSWHSKHGIALQPHEQWSANS